MHNINPVIWGPSAWDMLFTIFYIYPNNPNLNNKKEMKQFIYIFGKLLPCNSCRINYDNHLKNFSNLILNNKKNIIDFFIKIKKNISEITKRPLKEQLTYDIVIKKYSNTYKYYESVWDTIFYFSVVFPNNPTKEQTIDMNNFFKLLSILYDKDFSNIKNINNKDELIKSLIILKNNKDNKKITYTDIINKYLLIDENNNESTILIILIIIIILILIVYTLYNYLIKK